MFICSPTGKHFGYFQFQAIINNGVINIYIQKAKDEVILHNSLCEKSITQIPNPDQKSTRKLWTNI